jgi:hypothetical protein
MAPTAKGASTIKRLATEKARWKQRSFLLVGAVTCKKFPNIPSIVNPFFTAMQHSGLNNKKKRGWMNQYHTGAGNGSAHICYLSPRGHYYVAQGELDTRYARHAELITRYQPSMTGKMTGNLSQLELAKRASRS